MILPETETAMTPEGVSSIFIPIYPSMIQAKIICIYIYIEIQSVLGPSFCSTLGTKTNQPIFGAIDHRAQAIPVFVRSQRWIVQCHPEWILR
jgi:hypothetical protein